MHACPICGATSNRKGDPFESVEAVIGHVDAKRDAQHQGKSGADVRGDVEEVDEPASVADGGTPTASTPSSGDHSGDESTEDDFTGHKLTDEQLHEIVEHERESAYEAGYTDGYDAAKEEHAGGSEEGGIRCEQCGGTNLFNPAKAVALDGADPRDYPDLAEYDYGCEDCSTDESWAVFNY